MTDTANEPGATPEPAVDPHTASPMNRRAFLANTALVAGAGMGGATLLSACNAAAPNPVGGATASSSTGSTASAAAAGGSKTTLTVMYASTELTKAHIAAFQKLNPDIRIQFIENDATRLTAMLAAGTPPDFIRGAGVGSANNNARGLAASLDDYLAASTTLTKADLLPVNDAWRWDGTTSGKGPYYGITKDWSQDATLWQNTSMFQSAGVAPLDPMEAVTWDDLLETARKLTVTADGKTKQFGLGVEWAWGTSGQMFSMILQQNGSIYNADLTETDFTTPAAKRAFQWYVDYGTAAVGPTSLNPLPDGWDLPSFQAKKMASSQNGYWFGGNFASGDGAALQSSIRLAPAPMMDKRVSPCFAGIGAWIPEKSKNKDAAWKLMEFFMAGPPALERAKSGWGLPALKSLWTHLPQSEAYQKAAYKSAKNELKYLGLLPDSPYVNSSNWISELDKGLQAVLKGKTSVDDACAKITDNVNKLLKQGKDQIG
ncbi:MAG TPA: extracellular solute-binding protein [Actinopolymorphaceae bacterium]|jgi:multiple sugar transport system substrate-binding protein